MRQSLPDQPASTAVQPMVPEQSPLVGAQPLGFAHVGATHAPVASHVRHGPHAAEQHLPRWHTAPLKQSLDTAHAVA